MKEASNLRNGEYTVFSCYYKCTKLTFTLGYVAVTNLWTFDLKIIRSIGWYNSRHQVWTLCGHSCLSYRLAKETARQVTDIREWMLYSRVSNLLSRNASIIVASVTVVCMRVCRRVHQPGVPWVTRRTRWLLSHHLTLCLDHKSSQSQRHDCTSHVDHRAHPMVSHLVLLVIIIIIIITTRTVADSGVGGDRPPLTWPIFA